MLEIQSAYLKAHWKCSLCMCGCKEKKNQHYVNVGQCLKKKKKGLMIDLTTCQIVWGYFMLRTKIAKDRFNVFSRAFLEFDSELFAAVCYQKDLWLL